MKLVILDRDGTVNEDSDDYIKSPEEWRPIKGSLEAIARLTQADYRVVVATNQSGIARGLFDTRTLFAIHDTMLRALAQHGGRIDAFFFCPHAPEEQSDCRKPLPGLMLQIADRYDLEGQLSKVPMVCDTARDLQAAQAAGCEPHLVRTGRAATLSAEELAQSVAGIDAVQVHEDLAAFVEFLLHREHTRLGVIGEDSRPVPLTH